MKPFTQLSTRTRSAKTAPFMLAMAATAALSLAQAPATAGEGLRYGEATATSRIWPQWQARHTVLASPVVTLSIFTPLAPSAATEGLRTSLLVGDYFFNQPGLSWWPSSGVLRASSGLMITSRIGQGLRGPNAAAATPAPGYAHGTSALPYIGFGYSGLSVKGGWSVTADIGLVAEGASSFSRTSRALLGSQSLDGALRELRLTPLLQLGVRYAF
jgi:hypothetical protein